MYKYIIKRVLLTIPVLLCVLLIVFTIMSLTPGEPARLVLGAEADQAAIEAFNEAHGLNASFGERLFNYVKDIVTNLDFGRSYRSDRPVFDMILGRFPITFNLAALSIFFSAVIGIVLGVISAVKQYSALDVTLTVTAMVFASIPSFWLGMMLILEFSLNLHMFPSNGADTWVNYVLPVITLSVSSAAGLLRMTRSAMLETVRMEYIRTARAKGASPRDVVYKHALKNVLLPVVTSLGLSFGMSLGGAVVIEQVFSIPGLGMLMVSAIRDKDFPLVMASILFLAALFCLVMLIVDLIYAFIDPRIKAKYTS